MHKNARLFFVLLLAVILAGCQQANSFPGSVQATVTRPTPTPDLSSPLIGTYMTTITAQDIAGHPELDTGYQKENAGGMAIRGISATYAWQLSGTTLTLRTASDLCTPRHIVLASHPWMRVD